MNGLARRRRRAAAAAAPAAAATDAPERVADHRRRRRRRGRRVAAAGHQRAQRLRDARGVGVLEVDDEHVAAGAPGRVELLDQRLHARRARRVVGAQHHAVGARVGDERDALLRVARLPRAARRRFRAEQPIDQRHDVERRRVLQRDHRSARRPAAGRATR